MITVNTNFTVKSIEIHPLITFIKLEDGRTISVAWDGEKLNWMGINKNGIIKDIKNILEND